MLSANLPLNVLKCMTFFSLERLFITEKIEFNALYV